MLAGKNMKFLCAYFIVLLLITYSIKGYAEKSNIKDIDPIKSNSDLIINSSAASQLLVTQDLTATLLDSTQALELTPTIKGEVSSQLLSIEAGMIQTQNQSNWSKYYFQGAVTLHQHDELNVSLMANIEQIKHYNHQKHLFKSPIALNETELSYSYGIITSYSISSSWQLSGGIIHAESLKDSTQTTWYGDANLALIGTTYSF